MEVRNSKKISYKRIYLQIVKNGKTIPELAKEYDVDETTFIERMETGLEHRAFSKALKANERNMKAKSIKAVQQTTATLDTTKQEDNTMAAKKHNKKTTKVEENMSVLEGQRADIIDDITNTEGALVAKKHILSIREKAVTDTQRVYDKAKKALSEAQSERDKAKNAVSKRSRHIEELKIKLEDVEKRITELKNKAVYLVAPGYAGEKPSYGTYFSTTEVVGFDTLSVVGVATDFVIEPELKDMVVAGYDSYKEYMEGLRFAMLCVEYTYRDIEHSVLVEDERLKNLLKAHVG